MARIFQGESFNVELSDPSKPNQPDIIYIKTKEKGWQQFFLDAGLGFWEDWEKFEKEYEDEFYIDYVDFFWDKRGVNFENLLFER